MTATFYVVYDNVRENTKAFFKEESDAINWATPNGWTVEEARITVPYVALSEHVVTPV